MFMTDNTEMNANILSKLLCKYLEMVTTLENCIDELTTKAVMTTTQNFGRGNINRAKTTTKKPTKLYLFAENKNKNK